MENQLVYYLGIAFVLFSTAYWLLLLLSTVKKLKASNKHFEAYVKNQSKLITQKQSKINELETELSKQRTQKNGRELDEFLADIKTHGYGVVRIDPDNVFYRGR